MTPDVSSSTVLSLNCGSSSLKFMLATVNGDTIASLVEGEAQSVGTPDAQLAFRTADGGRNFQRRPIESHTQAAENIFAILDKAALPRPDTIGHRVVHGGPTLRAHCLIDDRVFAELDAARAFAPLHGPAALEVIALSRARYPDRPQIACLDTAFHYPLPQAARRLPIGSLPSAGIERYGFHGLSCELIVRQFGAALPRRLVIAHLGGGCSVTAVESGRSVDTSMGLTPSGGMMMATRAGDLDPGLVLYLIRELGFDARRLEAFIDHESGLKGVSGLSGDVRRLHTAEGDPSAHLALKMFVQSARKQIAAMASVLQGLDCLVFTGGIGEHDVETVREIASGLAWLGVEACPRHFDTVAWENCRRPTAAVMSARENEQIGRHAAALAALA